MMDIKPVVCLLAVSAVAVCTAEAGEVPRLNDLPKVNRLWLGMEEGFIRPASYEQVMSESQTRLSIHAEHGSKIVKGQHWGTLDPVHLALEKRAHEIESIRAKQDLARELATLEDERVKMLVAQQEALAKLKALEFAATDKSLPLGLRERSKVAAVKLENKIKVIDKALTPEAHEQQRDLLKRDSALKQERRKKQLVDLEKRSLLVAGCDGTLILGDTVIEAFADADAGEIIWVDGNELIGVVRNDNHHELWVDAKGPLMGQLPVERISVRIQDTRNGGLIPARHDRTEEIESGNEIRRTYVFRIGEKDSGKASESIGVRSLVHIFINFEKPYRMVYKKDIAHIDPARLEAGGWASLIHHLWPGSKVVHVGPQTIAVKAPNEN